MDSLTSEDTIIRKKIVRPIETLKVEIPSLNNKSVLRVLTPSKVT